MNDSKGYQSYFNSIPKETEKVFFGLAEKEGKNPNLVESFLINFSLRYRENGFNSLGQK